MVQFFDKNGDPQLDPYEILSLPQTSTDAQIKKAYRMQMLQLHPDKLSPTLTTVQIEQITEQFHNVKDAYEFLISPVYLTSRRMYMTKLSARRAEYERKEAYIRRHGSCNTAPVGTNSNSGGRNEKYDSRSSSGGYTVPNNYSRGGTHSNVNTSGTAHAERMKSMHRSQSAPAMNHSSDRRHSSNNHQSRDRRRNVNNSTKYYTNRGRQHGTNTKNTHTMGRDIRYKRDNVRVKPRSYNVNSKYHEQHESNQQHRSRSQKREGRDKQYSNRGKSEEPRRSSTQRSSDRRKESSSRSRHEHRSRSRVNQQRDRSSDVRQQYYQENDEKKKRRRAKSAPARYARNMKNRFSSKPTNNNKSSSNNKRSSSKDKLPSKYYCPLTKKLYKDPVIDNEGNTYERSAILKWLRKESCSPITNEYLCEEMLKSDVDLKREIYKLIGKPRSKSQSRQKSRPNSPSNDELVCGRVLIDSYLCEISSNSKLSINLDGMGICAFSYRRITFVIEVPITPHAGFMVYSSFNYDNDQGGDVDNTISNKIEAWNDWLQNIKRSSRVSYTQQTSSNKLVFTLRGSEFDMNKCTTFQKTLEYFIEMSLKLYNILQEQQNGSGEMKQVDNVCLTRTPVAV